MGTRRSIPAGFRVRCNRLGTALHLRSVKEFWRLGAEALARAATVEDCLPKDIYCGAW
jgi:hypothetical protein